MKKRNFFQNTAVGLCSGAVFFLLQWLSSRVPVWSKNVSWLKPVANKDFVFSLPLPAAAIYFLSFGSLVVLTAFFYRQQSRQGVSFLLGYGLLLAGALSNLVERWRQNFVWDYLKVDLMVLHGVWNFADLAIVAGVALWLWNFFGKRGRPKANPI